MTQSGLNPFMNQVYFYSWTLPTKEVITCVRLNPFMNQVYFYPNAWPARCLKAAPRLNPFMNQVYFYRYAPSGTPGKLVILS